MIQASGRIEVITGSMYCGKTEELIRRIRRAVVAKQSVQVFKPNIDTRFKPNKVRSHSGYEIGAISVFDASEVLPLINPNTTVVAVDEVQFFDWQLVGLVQTLAFRGIRVILAGLDTDFKGEPFGTMPTLVCIAEDVVKLHAICAVCGEEASRTQRLVNGQPAKYSDPLVLIGAEEAYEARCRIHHQVPRF